MKSGQTKTLKGRSPKLVRGDVLLFCRRRGLNREERGRGEVRGRRGVSQCPHEDCLIECEGYKRGGEEEGGEGVDPEM